MKVTFCPATFTPGLAEILEVRAIDYRGTPVANELHYRIHVRQLFYKSWWFYLFIALLAIGLAWLYFRMRLLQVKRVQLLRQQIASDLHDEVGSLLTSITMTSDNLRFTDYSAADRSTRLNKIASLSRTAASSMSDILWSIDARNDYTGNLADRFREHAEEMLLPRGIELNIDFNVSQRMSIASQLRQQLYLIFKEAINNIVKHSTAGTVKISYQHNEQGFRLMIANDGFFEKERKSTKGQGLKNMEMRAGRIHAVMSHRVEGAEFLIEISGR